MPDPDTLLVSDDERDFYGRQYYESYLTDHYNLPKLADRMRTDLPERCLHWLRALLRFKLPPGRVLELGSAHGGFVAMLRWAGFDGTGLELSPWLVELSRATFGFPVLQGPVETQNIPDASLDAVVLMDVIEHLADPEVTLRHCLKALKPGGVLLIQTPRYCEGKTYSRMVAENDPFLVHLKPEQHLFLFSDTAMGRLLGKLGLSAVELLPPIFVQYDMFVAASRQAFATTAPSEITASLIATSSGRLVDALLQHDDHLKETMRLRQVAEDDRIARLRVIEDQGRQLGEVEAQRNDLQFEMADLRRQFEEAQADRAARLQVIVDQGRQLGEVEAQRNDLQFELADLRRQFEEAQADRAARLQVIVDQGRQLGEVEAACNALIAQHAFDLQTVQCRDAELGGIRRGVTQSMDRLLAFGTLFDELRPGRIPTWLGMSRWARFRDLLQDLTEGLRRTVEGKSDVP
ncbi:MAG TPA: methyltransferase domain-containing protein [Terracidiphilus sp.]|nr:methyltransferase domain-containing protein [Terracidiphilus sp.]